MPRGPTDYKSLKRQLNDLISMNPVHVQCWVLVTGDGLGTGNSYQFTNSYVGIEATLGRQIPQGGVDQFNNSGTFRNFIVVLPFDATKRIPQRNDQLILYDMNGNVYARCLVQFVRTYDAGTSGISEDTRWKIECAVVLNE